MKVGIVGKGGVGKTTFSSLLAQEYSRRGRKVLAVDTDSNPNLGVSLGLTLEETEAVPVLPRSLILGSDGGMTADELVAEYGRPTPSGATLLSAIRVTEAGAGCTCAGHGTVRNFLGEVLGERTDVTLIDMEAGLEHLSRAGGTLAYADVILVVMEPSRKSLITAARTMGLAAELGIPRVYGVGNKAQPPDDVEFFHTAAAEHGITLAGVLPHDRAVTEADRAGTAVDADSPEGLRSELARIVDFVEGALVEA